MNTKITGLVAAPFVPLHADSQLNLSVIPAYADYLMKSGVAGVFVNGTTGEGASLSLSERKEVAAAWQQHGDGLKIIVHVGQNSLPEAKELAAHAEQIGADAVGLLSPTFFKPALPELVSFCAEVARAAPALPFYYYHIPSMSGVQVSMPDFLKAARGKIPTLAGVKFTYENLMEYQQCLALDDGCFDILFGRDEMLLAGLSVGARGAVGSTYNYAAPLYIRLMAAFERGDTVEARNLQTISHRLVDLLIASGNGVVCGKAMMPLLAGIDCGDCRLPLPAFSSDKRKALRESVEIWKSMYLRG